MPMGAATASAPWAARGSFAYINFNGADYLIGGMSGSKTYNYDYHNDAWRSVDGGLTWTRATASAAWPPSANPGDYGAGLCVVGPAAGWGNTMLLVSGRNNSVWTSGDGGTWTPVTQNDPELAKRLNAVMVESFGPNGFMPFQQTTMGAEDFAYFVGRDTGVPGYYFAVGGTPPEVFEAAKNGGAPVPSHHSPLFQIAPRPSVTLGIEAMVAAVLELAPAS